LDDVYLFSADIPDSDDAYLHSIFPENPLHRRPTSSIDKGWLQDTVSEQYYAGLLICSTFDAKGGSYELLSSRLHRDCWLSESLQPFNLRDKGRNQAYVIYLLFMFRDPDLLDSPLPVKRKQTVRPAPQAGYRSRQQSIASFIQSDKPIESVENDTQPSDSETPTKFPEPNQAKGIACEKDNRTDSDVEDGSGEDLAQESGEESCEENSERSRSVSLLPQTTPRLKLTLSSVSDVRYIQLNYVLSIYRKSRIAHLVQDQLLQSALRRNPCQTSLLVWYEMQRKQLSIGN
jgi:hypothetical protein